MKPRELETIQASLSLEAVDEAFDHLRGVFYTLRFMAEVLGVNEDTPANTAFWAAIVAGEEFVSRGLCASGEAHEIVKGPNVKRRGLT